MAGQKKGTQPPRPILIRRPWQERRKATSEDMVRLFGSGSVRYTPPLGVKGSG